MKYYCIEYDHCGYYNYVDNFEDTGETVCPQCFSILLPYEDASTPAFQEDTLILEDEPASHDAG